MAVESVIRSVFGPDDFSQYEQNVYKKYEEMAEREVISKLNKLLSNISFLIILKEWSSRCACRFLGYREITLRLKSGHQWKVFSPVFLRAKSKRKRGRYPKQQKNELRHLGLELLGIIKRISPALIEICVSMAVLCPSFEVAANALRGFGITMNEHLLQNITMRFVRVAKSVRVECNNDDSWNKCGIKIW